ncbi:MAG: hypothetical protein ABI591_12060 [Kofleriaceae bacterium]
MARRDPTRRTAITALLGAVACRATTAPAPPRAPGDFLDGVLRERGRGLLAVTDPDTNRFAIYDSALAALVMLRRGRRDDAGRLLVGLAALQYDDGALPFSFTGASPGQVRFVRAGAVAWVGYAAAEYLDADVGGRDRDLALHLAHQAAAYLLRVRVVADGDPRDGLIAGGEGDLRYDISGRTVHETMEPGALAWVSVEHNVDAYFFFRALARVTDTDGYAEAAARLAATLIARAWRDDLGQFARGVGTHGLDAAPALDCASWGAAFLVAAGDPARARIAFATAERRYASRDPRTGVTGYRAYADGPVFEDPRLQRFYQSSLSASTWDRLDAVWPEGSAGVALAALRTGRADRAREILDALEPLRLAGGAMPTFTLDVPFTFDTDPSVAGTAWAELVRFELSRSGDRPTLWVP